MPQFRRPQIDAQMSKQTKTSEQIQTYSCIPIIRSTRKDKTIITQKKNQKKLLERQANPSTHIGQPTVTNTYNQKTQIRTQTQIQTQTCKKAQQYKKI